PTHVSLLLEGVRKAADAFHGLSRYARAPRRRLARGRASWRLVPSATEKGLFPAPGLSERCHRGLARRQAGSRRALEDWLAHVLRIAIRMLTIMPTMPATPPTIAQISVR